jgi:hypothetical protein
VTSTLAATWRFCSTHSYKDLPNGLWLSLTALALLGYALSTVISHSGYFRLCGLPLAFVLFWRTSRTAGALAGLGFACNFTAMATNGWAMPIAPDVAFGPQDASHTLLNAHSQFAFLTDRFWSAVSLGDLLIMSGVAVFCLSWLRTSHANSKPS